MICRMAVYILDNEGQKIRRAFHLMRYRLGTEMLFNGVENMSGNEGIRIVSLFVGVLLCTALMQTACAALNMANLNPNAGNVTAWNNTTGNKAVVNTTWSSSDGSLPPSNLMNTPAQSPNFINAPKFSDLMSGSLSLNGLQFPKTIKR